VNLAGVFNPPSPLQFTQGTAPRQNRFVSLQGRERGTIELFVSNLASFQSTIDIATHSGFCTSPNSFWEFSRAEQRAQVSAASYFRGFGCGSDDGGAGDHRRLQQRRGAASAQRIRMQAMAHAIAALQVIENGPGSPAAWRAQPGRAHPPHKSLEPQPAAMKRRQLVSFVPPPSPCKLTKRF
jgi:hypothetical protein